LLTEGAAVETVVVSVRSTARILETVAVVATAAACVLAMLLIWLATVVVETERALLTLLTIATDRAELAAKVMRACFTTDAETATEALRALARDLLTVAVVATVAERMRLTALTWDAESG